MDFLRDENLCGQNLLRITSRGSAIIAELFRLSANIPDVFLAGSNQSANNNHSNNASDISKDKEYMRYADVLFDFQYLREPEEFEKRINESSTLVDLDQDFQENYQEILERFYRLFESIWKYQADFSKYIDDVTNGFYIQHSLDSILQEIEGKQLLTEALYLYGVMLLLLEEKVPGFVREKMVVALYRLHGDGGFINFEDVSKLCRNTGYIPSSFYGTAEARRPKGHPESYLARFPINSELVRLIIGRLQTDDVYLMANSFPNPDHRSARLAVQASYLFVILFFYPDMLNTQKSTMREIVDKYFNDNWVIATYMGQIYDIAQEWAPYPAAKQAIGNVITPQMVKQISERNSSSINSCTNEVKQLLKEGLLQQDYLLDNLNSLLNCVRNCNITLRWRLLHRRTKSETVRKIIESTANTQSIVALLLNVSELEYNLKEMLQQLIAQKNHAWTAGRASAAERMTELSEYFTGEKSLSRVKKDENMMRWFAGLAAQVESLNLEEDHATATGRKIQGLIVALEDVEQFEAIDANAQIKTFLTEARDIFRMMIRTVNVKTEVLSILENISDLSYAWQTLEDYTAVLHARIQKDPLSVVQLRATFQKAASILEVPLVRIYRSESLDAESVAEYYSGELVEWVRSVLEVIPVSVFSTLNQIVAIQTNRMVPIPTRLEAKDLKDFAQLDMRYDMAKLTHEISRFTEGILEMEKTLLGVIQVDPRQILEEGLRRELVRQVAQAMHTNLTFKEMSRQEIDTNMSRLASSLDGLKRSIEYLQDYIGIAGLKIFQQELGRVINYNTEQEANRYLKRKTFDGSSRYQSKAIPIPRFPTIVFAAPTSTSSSWQPEETEAVNFMGRVMCSLLNLTDPARTIYAPECSAWFFHTTTKDQKVLSTSEVCGIRTFALLEKSIGVIGLRGLDRLLAFRTVHIFNSFLKMYKTDVKPFRAMLDQVREVLYPEHKIPPDAAKLYSNAMKKVEGLMQPILKILLKIGQGQLIRRQIANLLQFGCQLDAHLLFQALDTFNKGLLNDVKKHYSSPDAHPYPAKGNPLLRETAALLEACGLDDPSHKIYVTSQPLEGLPVLLLLFILTCLPKLEYDNNFGALVRKTSKYPLDGIPLAIGLACLLRQFHPIYTKKLLSYIGQFVRSNLQQIYNEVDTKPQDIPRDILNILVFMEQLCHYSSLPRSLVHQYIPPYIFDALKFAPIATKK